MNDSSSQNDVLKSKSFVRNMYTRVVIFLTLGIFFFTIRFAICERKYELLLILFVHNFKKFYCHKMLDYVDNIF